MTTTPPPPPLPLELAAGSASPDLKPVILFRFGGQGDAVALVGYTKLAFSIFNRCYILVLLGLSSLY